MKKILVLLSMFALASGAWAFSGEQIPEEEAKSRYQYAYTWVVDSQFAQSDFPGDTVVYLLDTKAVTAKGQYKVLAYATMDDSGVIPYVKENSQVALEHTSLPSGADVDKFVNVDHALTNASYEKGNASEAGGTRYDKVQVNFRTNEDIYNEYLAHSDASITTGDADGLAVVVASLSTKTVFATIDKVHFSTAGTLGATFTVVPEPTSALLLLLGVAGLALKRKKAA